MYRYKTSMSRVAAAATAAALTAIITGVLVIIPARIEAAASEAHGLAATIATVASTGPVTSAAVDLLAIHELETAPCAGSQPHP